MKLFTSSQALLGSVGADFSLQPPFKQLTGWTKQQHTLVVVTRQEGQWAESLEKNTGVHSAQSTFVETPNLEPVDSSMQIFPLDPPCGGRLNSKDAGYITSPGYPQDYPSHQNCEWIVYAPEPNQKIVLNFNPHFEIEKHDCK
ncbi:Neuropilin-2 [Galemys pyrenaicus]|uniref:Neuropilin-2 n=1 Tax=Galemys pyrenaicus TaxID=202257 RepID=A0A8J6AG06_GALPY|nr:Neuropilin-2 [Galemys pyrenaicus]